jgi:hypothetical protein
MRRFLLSLLLLSILPGVAGAQPLPPVKDEGPQGAVHQQHAGKIVFSRRKIDRAPKSAEAFTDRFTLKDPLYLRPMFARSMENALLAMGVKCWTGRRRFVRVQVDATPEKEWPWIETIFTEERSFREWTTFSLDQDGDKPLTHGPLSWPKDRATAKAMWATRVVPTLTPGEHTLVFRVTAECRGKGPEGLKEYRVDVATGTLKLTVGAADVAWYLRTKGPHIKAGGHPESARLRAEIKRTVEAKWTTEDVLHVVVLSARWFVKTDRWTSKPIERNVEAGVVVRKKGATTCRLFSLAFFQKWAGGGWPKGLDLYTGGMDEYPCALAR